MNLASISTFSWMVLEGLTLMALISATGIVESKDMLRYGMLMTVVSSVILIALFYILGVVNLI